jgi:type IV secretion system protein VirB9
MKKAILLLLGTTVLSPQAFALSACHVSADDTQVRICDYAPTQRYMVVGLVGYPVNLEFAPDEQIKRIEFAYTGQDEKGRPTPTWRGPKKNNSVAGKDKYQNNLPIWPFKAGQSALVVVTEKQDSNERTYLFDLVAQKPSTDCDPAHWKDPGCPGDVVTTATLEFNYPTDVAAAQAKKAAEQKKAAIEAWKARRQKAAEQAAIDRLKVDVFYGQQNYNYQAKADPKYRYLAPAKVSDNGWLTEMKWPANVQIPAITILDPATGQERVPMITREDGMEVINGTAEWFRLRLGAAVMDIHNLAWSPNRPDPRTGTTSPDVIRQVIYRDAAR